MRHESAWRSPFAMVSLAVLILAGCAASTSHVAPVSSLGTGGRPPATSSTLSTSFPTTTSSGVGATTSTTVVPGSSPPGSFQVASTTLYLVDTSRPTVSYGHVVATSRTLTTTVWYPVTGGPYPLIIFAHGFQVGPPPYIRICQLWASAGYVVAAPAFPLTDAAVAGSDLDEHDVVNQPADVTFVISSILGASASAISSPLQNLVAANDIAVAGHSDGADTALAVGYLPGDRDPRIHAVMADGPDPLAGVSTASPLQSSTPLLLVHGTADTVVPFASSVTVTQQLKTPGWFLQLLGANHLPPIEGPSVWTPLLDTVTTDFFNIELKGAPAGEIAAAVGPSPVGHVVSLPN